MNEQAVNAIAREMLEATKSYVAKAMAVEVDKLKAQCDALKKEIGDLQAHRVCLEDTLAKQVSEAVAALPTPKDGKDADESAITGRVMKAMHEAVAAIPRPKDGESVDYAQVEDMVVKEVREAIEKLPPPQPGKDADESAITERVMKAMREAVAAIPRPKDGESVHPDTVKRMVVESVREEVARIPVPRDGRDAAQLSILPGIDSAKSYPAGTWATHNGGLWTSVRKTDPFTDDAAAAGWLSVVDGIAGVAVVQQENLRTYEWVSVTSSGLKTVVPCTTPSLIWRDVWKAGEFERGDAVTWSGSVWHCQVEKTTAKPGESPDWKLMVKAGRDGRDLRPDDGKKGDNIVRLK